jgi:hypothetical protein
MGGCGTECERAPTTTHGFTFARNTSSDRCACQAVDGNDFTYLSKGDMQLTRPTGIKVMSCHDQYGQAA